MVYGVFGNVTVFVLKVAGISCNGVWYNNIIMSFVMYFSYLVSPESLVLLTCTKYYSMLHHVLQLCVKS